MNKQIISTFKQTPKTKVGWAAFFLSVISILSGPILGISAAFIVPSVSEASSEVIGQLFGSSMIIILFGIIIAMTIFSIKAYRTGERSWAVILALVLSALSCLFWVFMLVGEIVFPH